MTDFTLPLDIHKPALEILVDAINQENRTAFIADELSFGLPFDKTLLNSDINTAITLTPKTGSKYFSSVTVHYKRMDLDYIYKSSQIEITVGDRLLLSDLIPEINQYYGINLTVDDYYDQPLPTIDPLDPNKRLLVTLQAKPESILFIGSAIIALNEARVILDKDNVERKYYIVVESFDKSVYDNTLVCINSDFIEFSPFQVLKNATAVRRFRVDKMLQLSNGNIHLRGSFDFTADLGIGSTDYLVRNVVINSHGICIIADDTDIYGPASVDKWRSHWNGLEYYVIDNDDTLAINSNRVYKYDIDGQLIDWTVADLAYVPKQLAIDKNGKVYTVSDIYTDVTKKIRIDRFLSTGEVDLSFMSVILGITGSQDPMAVVDIQPVDNGGFYIALEVTRSEGTLSLGYVPIINDVPIIDGGETQIYAFNPIIKFTEDGTRDTNFNILLKNNEPNSIYTITNTNQVVGDRVLAPRLDGVTYFTNRLNPITGFIHRAPISFTTAGEQIRISGNAYAGQIRWLDAREVHYQTNGKYLVCGSALLRLPQGGWSDAKSIVALYLQSGELDTIIYTAPVVAGPALAIHGCGILQLDY